MDAILTEIGGWAGAGNIVGVGLVVLFLLLGKLRPEKQFTELREDRDARIAEVIAQIAIWKEALAEEGRRNDTLDRQLQIMVEERDQTRAIVQELLRAVRPEGGPDA